MLIRSLAAAMAFVFMTLPGMAGPLAKVDVPPIDHLDATLVVIGADGTDHVYTPADLEGFETYSLSTKTPWRDEPAEFVGVLLTDILAASGLASVDSIEVTAENDYRTIIDRQTWESVDILVATRVDGGTVSRRARGPIQFVIDMDAFNASEFTSQSNLVWMAARIEANG